MRHLRAGPALFRTAGGTLIQTLIREASLVVGFPGLAAIRRRLIRPAARQSGAGSSGSRIFGGVLPPFPLQKRGKSCLMRSSMMNLPERRDTQPEPSSIKPGLRPRPIQSREGGAGSGGTEGGGMLHFSCPACLRMISGVKGTEALACPLCEAQVVPPQLATGRGAKTHLPIRAKSGRLK